MAGIFKSKTFIFFAVVAILLVAGKIYYAQKYPSGTWRYKMTVEVETPEGLKTGSAVREVTIHSVSGRPLFPEATFRSEVKGEAVIVNLGHGKYLFALLNANGSYEAVFKAFPFQPGGGSEATPAGVRYYSHLKNVSAIIPPKNYPRFVTFKNLQDPKSVEAVDPGNLAATFGPGYRIRDVRIEMTDEKVTWGIKRIIPSFGIGTGFNEWQRTLRYGDPLRLDRSNFIRR